MNKVNKNKITPDKKEYLEVIAESINEKFEVIIEGQQALNQKFDKLEENLDEFKEEMGEFKNENRSSFGTVFEYLSKIDDEITEIKEELKSIRKDLLSKAEVARVDKLEFRVAYLEKELAKR